MIEKPLRRYTELDSGALCRLFRQPDIYIPSADDNTKPQDLMRFIDNALLSEVFYILGRDPKSEAFIFAPSHNSTTFISHFAVRQDKRDGGVVRKVAEAGKWIFDNTTCRAVIAFVRAENKGSRSVLSQLGLKKVGETKGTLLFNGEFVDELIYQCTHEDFNRLWASEFGEVI